MKNVRVWFEKKGAVRYISHLDLTRNMSRGIKLSGLPVWYTEGFNPHVYMTFALPISLGFESLCETMDIRLTQPMPYEEIKERLNRVLPEGIFVTKCAEPVKKANMIAYSRYVLDVRLSGCAQSKEVFERFFAQPQILVMKKSKRGEKQVDLRPDINLETVEESGGALQLTVLLPSGNEKTVNPMLLLGAFAEYANCPLDRVSVSRTAVYTADFEPFC